VNERPSLKWAICGSDKAVVIAGAMNRGTSVHLFLAHLLPSMAILLGRFRVAREEQLQFPEKVL
jgi:hypothetical protein